MPDFISAADAGRMAPNLVRIINRAAADNPGLFALNPLTPATLRTQQQQQEMVSKGWSKTMRSKHLTGQAIDVVPINPKTGQPDADYLGGYPAIKAAIYKAATAEGLPFPTWGGDWKSFKDRPHWEVSQPAPAATTQPATATTQPAAAQPSTTAAQTYTPEQRRNAIASIESGGNYGALGPNVSRRGGAGPGVTDRAYGRYQVMGSNIPAWTQAALGKSMTPEQFLADKDAQDKVFDSIFGNYVQKYGEEGAAQAWFGGEGSVGKAGRKDVLGTSVGSYGQRYLKALGAPASSTPATTPTTPATATAQPAPPTPAAQPAQPPSIWSTVADAGSAFDRGMASNPYTAPPIPPTPGAARIDESAAPTVDPQQQQINQQRMQIALQLLNAGRLV